MEYHSRSVGIDLVTISEIEALDKRTNGNFVKSTFTDTEKEDAKSATDYYTFLSGRFAVKEAVFKSLAPLLPEKTFDFRLISTKRMEDGHPEVEKTETLKSLLLKAGACDILVSISNEKDLCIAIAEVI